MDGVPCLVQAEAHCAQSLAHRYAGFWQWSRPEHQQHDEQQDEDFAAAQVAQHLPSRYWLRRFGSPPEGREDEVEAGGTGRGAAGPSPTTALQMRLNSLIPRPHHRPTYRGPLAPDARPRTSTQIR